MASHQSAVRLGPSSARRLAAIVVWVCVIWGHSLIQGPQSSAESGLVYTLLEPLFRAFGVTDPDLCTFVIRKCAHFSEYAVLGVLGVRLSCALVGEETISASLRWAPVACCALVPVLDETLQLFVPGRSGSPRDVLIDLSGLVVGACLTTLVAKLRPKG